MIKAVKRQHQLLFCPGPVNIADNIKTATVNNEIGHREPEFSTLLRKINRDILAVFEVKNTRLFHPVLITGSGTAANEAILSSVVGQKHILILSNGEFGERLFDISSIHNPHTYHIRFAWKEKMNLKKIQNYIKTHKIDFIAMVHHETSTGMLNPIYPIGKLAKKNKISFIVDTVSSAGAEKIDLERCNIDFCSTSSGKALGALPGLGIIIGRKKKFEELKSQPAKTAYLNLYKLYLYSKNKIQTPNTPAVQLFFALEQALTNILEEGVIKRRNNILRITKILRTGMKRLGFEFLIDEKNMCSILTTVRLPNSIDFESLRKELKNKNIIIYNGKGPVINQVFQVGNIGNMNDSTVYYFLQMLEEAIPLITHKKVQMHISPNANTVSSSFLTTTGQARSFYRHAIKR